MKLYEKLLLRGDHVCPWWFAYTFDNPLRGVFHEPERMLGSYLQTGMSAVDLGCGMGHFSIGMAEIVGEKGLVIAVDVQRKMLEVVARRASRRGVRDRIQLHHCDPDDFGLARKVDFALAFWMVHEIGDRDNFFRQLRSILPPEGKILIAEPKMHVTAEELDKTIEIAQDNGLRYYDAPAIRLSRTVLLQKI